MIPQRWWAAPVQLIAGEMARRAAALERQAPLIEKGWREQEARRLRHAGQLPP